MVDKPINVYYSPTNQGDPNKDWRLLYYTPERLFDRLKKRYTKEENSFFSCPASQNVLKNTFVLINSMKSSYIFNNENTNGNVILDKSTGINAMVMHKPSIENEKLFVVSNFWVFFTEEDSLEMTVTSPFFEKTNYMKYGALVPAKFDIGKWFRNISLEFNLWAGVNEFYLEDEEPIVYLTFNTNRRVNLIRFNMTPDLDKIIESTGASTRWEPKVSLPWRYNRFKKSNMKDIVMKEIKNNIVELKNI